VLVPSALQLARHRGRALSFHATHDSESLDGNITGHSSNAQIMAAESSETTVHC
jgi:hypothetical protein